FDPCLLQLPPRENIIVGGYLQSYKYFDDVHHRIKKQLVFQDNVSFQASVLLNNLLDGHSHPRNATALVGVHVRRGDMLWRKNTARGYTTASRSYLFKAFQWFVDALPDKALLFVMVCEDAVWCEKYVGESSSVKMAPPASAKVHLALLASCDHMIMSTGTFGWWGAWLAGGKVVYYKNYPVKNSEIDKGFNKNDFFLPTWVGL
ncbi:galactoside 2-alpha-L-fucosyltransferase, partial [Elysia marginata]